MRKIWNSKNRPTGNQAAHCSRQAGRQPTADRKDAGTKSLIVRQSGHSSWEIGKTPWEERKSRGHKVRRCSGLWLEDWNSTFPQVTPVLSHQQHQWWQRAGSEGQDRLTARVSVQGGDCATIYLSVCLLSVHLLYLHMYNQTHMDTLNIWWRQTRLLRLWSSYLPALPYQMSKQQANGMVGFYQLITPNLPQKTTKKHQLNNALIGPRYKTLFSTERQVL